MREPLGLGLEEAQVRGGPVLEEFLDLGAGDLGAGIWALGIWALGI